MSESSEGLAMSELLKANEGVIIPPSTRSHLIDGRRVKVSDLLEAGLLDAGAELAFRRPRLGEEHLAIIREDGSIQLDDDRVFDSPSRAAGAAARGSVDGWSAWRIQGSNQSLDTVRQSFLDRINQPYSSDTPIDDVSSVQGRHTFLRRARDAAARGEPINVTVRDLIARWNAKSRGQVITARIDTDLDNHGLISVPDYRKVGLDSMITLRESAVESETGEEPADVASGEAEIAKIPTDSRPDKLDRSAGDVGITLGNIPSANTVVAHVSPNSTYDEAITIMLLNDYSQLAVMTNPPRGLKGAVTWQSIAREQHAKPKSNLSDAIVPAQPFRFDTELIDVLPTLQSHDFVFVTDEQNQISGIVTAADVVQAYGDMAAPFFLIGELDQLLRRVIADTFTLELVNNSCEGAADSFDDLTIGDYQRVLESRENWTSLGWPLDRRSFIHRLDSLRGIRNDIMHFNPDPIPEDVIHQMRTMIRLIRKYADFA